MPVDLAPSDDLQSDAVALPASIAHALSLSDGELTTLEPLNTRTATTATRITLEPAPHAPRDPPSSRALSLADFSAAAARQMSGVPVSVGWLCPIVHLDGVHAYRVASVEPAAPGPVLVDASTAFRLLDRPVRCAASANGSDDGMQSTDPSEPGAPAATVQNRLWSMLAPLFAAAATASSLEYAAISGGHHLLIGPSGAGKSTLLHAVCRRAAREGVTVIRLSCYDLVSGSTSLRAALSAPASAAGANLRLVHLEHLELFCHDDATSVSFSLPDGCASRGAKNLASQLRLASETPFVAIACVRDARRLPLCLRAHGAFDTEPLFVPPPSARERWQLLVAALLPSARAGCDDAEARQAAEVLATKIATHTAGMGRRALRRILLVASALSAAGALEARGAQPRGVPEDRRSGRFWAPQWRDVARAISICRNSGSEVLPWQSELNVPSTAPWSVVGGYAAIVKRLGRLTGVADEHTAGLHRLGVRKSSGALLYGPSGNGKTLLAKTAAAASGRAVLAVKGSQLFGQYVGETEAAIRSLFRHAAELAPSVILIDEIDALGASRDDGADRVGVRALSTLLAELDGTSGRGDVMLLACTNRPGAVDSALLRPGRIDDLILVPPPDEVDREAILKVHCARMRMCDDVSATELVARTDRFSCAALAALCREAALAMVARTMETSGANEVNDITAADFYEALELVRAKQVPSEMAFNRMVERFRTAFASASVACEERVTLGASAL